MQVMTRATLRSRRAVLRLAAGAVALGGVALLEACGPSSAPAPTAPPAAAPTTVPAQPTSAPAAAKPTTATASVATSAPTTAAAAVPPAQPTVQPGLVPGQLPISKSVTLPTRVPIPGAPPDLPGSADGLVDPGYINYPANPFKAVAETPGSGGDVTVATWTLAPPPPAVDSNALWQAVNKAAQRQPEAQHQLPGRLPDHQAGHHHRRRRPARHPVHRSRHRDQRPPPVPAGQVRRPDAVPERRRRQGLPQPRQLLRRCPGRASSSTKLSTACRRRTRCSCGCTGSTRSCSIKDGLQQPKNLDEYTSLLKHFTNPQQDLYGLATENTNGYGITNGFFTAMYGLPNNWGIDTTAN